ncbi:bifunctional 4-hydroxy-2-oxoglutarate aldolase/2-dehydro-3-deoxy-phosphogluconate aldolase [Actinotignum sanguinis]|uniref:2-dehydro-3-deoxy-phosphogluconate aldolase n=2 Tax=Actinomycetaceae TaxID=2049 RepID=A0ABZ0RDV5_9ACTO|nr:MULTISPECIES: bifunctional 4-hydroxy-2-oxoglutarate aldolase/2-dehydro-3-deoxy-phosphogluconate aldolase [Actinotignum]WPJ89650.1 bifunctional 4-hydroxy-2-oxoglutarate aldolase/2-dehydro-3-deoxy-phosphogluconate aldolase [Schaalia turicensis]MDE1553231.1 bifunctional 4-hydroxy-2-oxoglutarate aldolase/2-dehydro-3-deoxy-phosphogluconate aldolase [Actinotignum sanguinis]MDE1566123.1 bifunctional 4-hydroxy-2-oxoglutarate aldolase/2-dehydro-3-deoxy-phosphogluconate aldolase [Actinotignum sanguinis
MSQQLPDVRPFLETHPIVPVVVIDDAAQAPDAARALVAGGIHCAEVTFRTAAGGEAIKAMRDVEGMTVGAGTVLTRAQAETAADLGAKFFVSPGWSAGVADVAAERQIPYLPGVQTATEIMMALEYGATAVKFFPGGEAGGLPMVKALRGPFPNTYFVPSGGVKLANMAEWLSDPAILSVSGSWMIKRDLISSGNFAEITRLSQEASDLAKEIRK